MAELIDVVPGSGEWAAARRAGVTATDIVTICGLSSWDSVYSLYWRKLGQVPDELDSDRFALGRHMEPYAVKRWDNNNDGIVISGGLYRSSERPWQLATPDRIISPAPWLAARVGSPLECKSWGDADRHSWDDGPPPQVRAQVIWQMDVTDSSAGYVGVVFLPSGRFESYVIEHDFSYIPDGPEVDAPCPVCVDIKMMREAGEEFYRRMTLELPPPDPDSSAATLAALRARFTRTDGKEAAIDSLLWTDYDHACVTIAATEQIKRELEIRIREQAEGAHVLTVGGERVATRVIVNARVKAHVRHADYYRRVKAKETDND
jgi:putative phage-type endonuclease